MTDNRDETLYPHQKLSPDVTCDADFKRVYPHATRFDEALGAKLAQCSELPNRGTFWTSREANSRYRATFQKGVVSCNELGISAPIHADSEATIYALDYADAERCAEHIARDRVCFLIACALAQVEV